MGVESKRNFAMLDEYKTVTACSIYDAMKNLNIQGTSITDGPRALFQLQNKMAGYIRTLQYFPSTEGTEGLTSQGAMVDCIAEPGDVVVIDTANLPTTCACGSMMVLRAAQRELAGIVINGLTRDANEIIEIGFPVYCTGTTYVGPVPQMRFLTIDQPVKIGDATLYAGDFVFGDESGIIVVPAERAEEVLQEAKRIVKMEDLAEQNIRLGLGLGESKRLAQNKLKESDGE